MPNLNGEVIDLIEERDMYYNYPQSLKEYTGDYRVLDNETVIINDHVSNFTRIGNEIYEALQRDGDIALFVKIGSNNTFYNQTAERPQTNYRIADYSYLKSAEKSLKIKNILTAKEKENLECK